MKRSATVVLGLLIGTCGWATPATTTAADATRDEAATLAKKLTDEGAATFNKADAKAMAAYFTDNAIVFLQGQDENGVTLKEYDGRAEIERLYADFFKDAGTIEAKNTVEYARLLSPDVLVIAGTFEPNQTAAKPLKVPFYQVRIKQGDKWLIQSARIFVLPEKP